MVEWNKQGLEQLCERVSSLEEFFNRNHFTPLFDTDPEDPLRQKLMRSIKSLHGILNKMVVISEQRT